MRVPVRNHSPEPRKIRQAADAVRRGALVVVPEKTEYLLVTTPFSHKAILALEQCHATHRRSGANGSASLLVRNVAELSRFAVLGNRPFAFLRERGHEPIEVRLPATGETPRYLRPKRGTMLGIAQHEVTQRLLDELGEPLAFVRHTEGPFDSVEAWESAMPALTLDAGAIVPCHRPPAFDLTDENEVVPLDVAPDLSLDEEETESAAASKRSARRRRA